MKDNGIDPQEQLPKYFNIAMHRAPCLKVLFSPFFRDYGDIFKRIHQQDRWLNIDDPIFEEKMVINKLMYIYYYIFPVSDLESWTDDDFCYAAKFLRDEDGYNIHKALEPIDIDLSHCEYIKHLFSNGIFVNQDAWRHAQADLQEKKRNERKKAK